MRLLLIVLATLVFIVVQWGPVLYVARQQWLRGDPYSFRQLRFLMPAQLLATVSLAVAADLLGLRNPAALFAGATAVVSAAGAGALALYYRFRRRP
ncbi:hypothetical protein ASF61_11770 [Duganella sp. Leaf126]|uniref:hypothetical protein n=1 Tax=Duganella sp. Leaf126 TaxID=1736266 RepID=UPI0006FA989B|nr:hypothetical protein [Duganella sp. Leaf126]KQQ33717.1 hypothetical protein ASF61_11770 [Duganella sp. Leaf126]